MYLVSGLGNPGTRYQRTRHNVGFEIIDALAERLHAGAFKKEKKGEWARTRIGDDDVMLHRPLTFMNLSGEAVGPLARYYKIPPERLIVIHDELDFDPGIVRLKLGGGAGGNNGIKSIIQHFDPNFVRIRVGIGKPPSGRSGADFVLSRFAPDERVLIDEAIAVGADAVESIIVDGVSDAMNRFNRRES